MTGHLSIKKFEGHCKKKFNVSKLYCIGSEVKFILLKSIVNNKYFMVHISEKYTMPAENESRVFLKRVDIEDEDEISYFEEIKSNDIKTDLVLFSPNKLTLHQHGINSCKSFIITKYDMTKTGTDEKEYISEEEEDELDSLVKESRLILEEEKDKAESEHAVSSSENEADDEIIIDNVEKKIEKTELLIPSDEDYKKTIYQNVSLIPEDFYIGMTCLSININQFLGNMDIEKELDYTCQVIDANSIKARNEYIKTINENVEFIKKTILKLETEISISNDKYNKERNDIYKLIEKTNSVLNDPRSSEKIKKDAGGLLVKQRGLVSKKEHEFIVYTDSVDNKLIFTKNLLKQIRKTLEK